MRSIGTSTSSAVVTALLTAMTMDIAGVHLPTLDAFRAVFAVAFAMAMLGGRGGVVIPRMPRKVPVSTVVEAAAEARAETAS